MRSMASGLMEASSRIARVCGQPARLPGMRFGPAGRLLTVSRRWWLPWYRCHLIVDGDEVVAIAAWPCMSISSSVVLA